MLNKILEFLSASPSFREAFEPQEKGIHALYEMAEGQRPFFAAALAKKLGRPLLYIAPSDAAAMTAADDCAAWLQGGAALLPSADIHFTRGVASRENSFQRLSVLQKVKRGEIQILCASADALMGRMLPPAEYEKFAVQLQEGSRMDPLELIARLVKMGYERVDMVEGKGQCALRGAIVDAFSPAENGATRIEFWDDEVDSIRAFDPISQRSLDRMEEAVFFPAVEWLLSEEYAPSMRTMIRSQMNRLPDSLLSSDLPPLPDEEGESGEEKQPLETAGSGISYRVYDSGISRLFQDADQLEKGVQLPHFSLWAGALDVPCAWIWEYMDDPIIVLEEPDRIKNRCEDRFSGFGEDFKLSLERQEAVPEQGNLLRPWADIAAALSGQCLYLLQDMLHGMGELKPTRLTKLAGLGAPRYTARFKEMKTDLDTWRQSGYLTLLMAGGEEKKPSATECPF